MPPLRLTRYQDLKAKLLGPVSSPERDQFVRELVQELAVLAVTPTPPRKLTTRKHPRVGEKPC